MLQLLINQLVFGMQHYLVEHFMDAWIRTNYAARWEGLCACACTPVQVAVKVIDKKKAREDAYVCRNMRRESRLLQQIRHRHIIQLFEVRILVIYLFKLFHFFNLLLLNLLSLYSLFILCYYRSLITMTIFMLCFIYLFIHSFISDSKVRRFRGFH